MPKNDHPYLKHAGDIAWRVVAIAAAACVVFYLVAKLRVVVLPVVIGLFLASVLTPVVAYLKGKNWPPLLATWTTFLGALLLIAGLAAAFAPGVASELGDVGRSVQEGTEEVLDWLAEGPLRLSEAEVDRYLDEAWDQLSENRDTITTGVLSGATTAGQLIGEAILTLVMTFFYLKDGPKMWAWFVGLFRRERREHVNAMGELAWSSIGGFMRGTAVVGVVDAVLIGLVLVILGVPLVAPIAVLTFFGAFFPIVGATVAGAIGALVALVTEGVFDFLVVAGATLVIQQVEGDVLQPLVVGRALQLHAVVIILALTAGGIIAGIAGAFLAVPITAVAAKVVGYVRLQEGLA